MHVAGLTSLVGTYLRAMGDGPASPDEVAFSPLSSLVLLWLMYVALTPSPRFPILPATKPGPHSSVR